MTETVKITRLNAIYDKIQCEPSTAYELNDKFSFMIPNASFNPKVRNKQWDGRIRLFNLLTRTIYGGLRQQVIEYCTACGYDVICDDVSSTSFSLVEANKFIDTLNIPDRFERRDYQVSVFAHCVRDQRALILSPTSSGKSLMIYLLLRYFSTARTLLIVPRTTLVSQMIGDFRDYGGSDIEGDVHGVYGGQEKNTGQRITVSTWQSLQNMPKKWFAQFDMIIGDEAHGCKARELTRIFEAATNAFMRFGFTGTLDGTLTNETVLVGLFGPIRKATTLEKLSQDGHISPPKIKGIILQYSDADRQAISKMSYAEELNWLVSHPVRNRFIVNLALSTKGNTVVLYRFVEKHGIPLYNQLVESNSDRKIYFIAGTTVSTDEREEIRQIVMNEDNAIIVASIGSFAEGINIPNLANAIFACPMKTRIKVLQSLGRILRKHESKSYSKLYDIADDLRWKSKNNITLDHFKERIKTYASEKLPYKIYNVRIEE